MNDERLYARVVEELKASGPLPGLWAKAFAESNGIEAAARATYLRLRVAQLQALEEELKENHERLTQAQEKQPQHTAAPLGKNTLSSNSAYVVLVSIVLIMLLSAVVGWLTK